MSQSVEQRRREIGVRVALGAARRDILQLVIGRVAAISAAGIGTGLVLAVTTMPLLSTLLYHVTPADPSVFAPLALLLLGVTLAAGYIPARRATRVDPMITLRAE
jgi:ABC-type antimicrobial peptide transport system permease subunit